MWCFYDWFTASDCLLGNGNIPEAHNYCIKWAAFNRLRQVNNCTCCPSSTHTFAKHAEPWRNKARMCCRKVTVRIYFYIVKCNFSWQKHDFPLSLHLPDSSSLLTSIFSCWRVFIPSSWEELELSNLTNDKCTYWVILYFDWGKQWREQQRKPYS